nr:hypothetical protein CFP56_65686 [Quercus suber]
MCKQQWQTMENHLVLLKKHSFFFKRFALLVALFIPEAKDLALLCVFIANLVYFTLSCITLDDHVAFLVPIFNEETNKGKELEEPESKSDVGYEELLKPDDQNSGRNRVKEDEDTLYLHVNEETNKGKELEEPESKSDVGYEELLKPDDQNSGRNRVKEDEDTLYLHVRETSKGEKLIEEKAKMENDPHRENKDDVNNDSSGMELFDAEFHEFMLRTLKLVFRVAVASIPVIAPFYFTWHSTISFFFAYALFLLHFPIESKKAEEPLEGQTTNKDEPPQGDQGAAAEDKANNKKEDLLWSKNGLDFKMVEESWEDDDICEESWEADDPGDCSISNDWQQECGDLLDKKECNWKKLIFKRKMKDEVLEHNQPHHALMEQLKQLEHDNNTLAAKYQGIANEFDEQRCKWEEEKNELNAAKTYWYQAYLKLSYAGIEKLHVANESPESYKAHLLESEEVCNKLMDKNAMLAAKLIVETSSAEYLKKLVHEFEEKCRVLEAEKNDLNAKLFTATAYNELYKCLVSNFDSQ